MIRRRRIGRLSLRGARAKPAPTHSVGWAGCLFSGRETPLWQALLVARGAPAPARWSMGIVGASWSAPWRSAPHRSVWRAAASRRPRHRPMTRPPRQSWSAAAASSPKVTSRPRHSSWRRSPRASTPTLPGAAPCRRAETSGPARPRARGGSAARQGRIGRRAPGDLPGRSFFLWTQSISMTVTSAAAATPSPSGSRAKPLAAALAASALLSWERTPVAT